jgi:hypothetical protein
MLSRIALVASGLQALVCSSVTGTRNSLARKLSFRKIVAHDDLFHLLFEIGGLVHFQ